MMFSRSLAVSPELGVQDPGHFSAGPQIPSFLAATDCQSSERRRFSALRETRSVGASGHRGMLLLSSARPAPVPVGGSESDSRAALSEEGEDCSRRVGFLPLALGV